MMMDLHPTFLNSETRNKIVSSAAVIAAFTAVAMVVFSDHKSGVSTGHTLPTTPDITVSDIPQIKTEPSTP